MNTKTRVLLCLSPFILALQALPAADERPVAAPGEDGSSMAGHRVETMETTRASDLMGSDVRDARNERVAQIEDFLVDVENGRIVQVVVSSDAFDAGRGVIPPGAFDHASGYRVPRWEGERAKLREAPRYNPPGPDQTALAGDFAKVYSHYGVRPYFSTDGETAAKPPLNYVHTRSNVRSRPVQIVLGRVILASDLIGREVTDSQGEKAGKIKDLILDLPSGRVVAAIIGTGGFLGIGSSQHAVPASSLEYVGGEKDELRVAVTRERLKKSPRYVARDAGRFSDPVYTDGLYQAYDAPPYSDLRVQDRAVDEVRADASDRDDNGLTAADQGDSAADVETTARIRRAILDRDDLSVPADNVTIITRNGRVTLRGSVKTADEKRIVGEIAERAAGTARSVDNQLEVGGDAD